MWYTSIKLCTREFVMLHGLPNYFQRWLITFKLFSNNLSRNFHFLKHVKQMLCQMLRQVKNITNWASKEFDWNWYCICSSKSKILKGYTYTVIFKMFWCTYYNKIIVYEKNVTFLRSISVVLVRNNLLKHEDFSYPVILVWSTDTKF